MQTKLTRFDPVTGTTRWSEGLDQFFDDCWRADSARETALLSPAIDISEDDAELAISAELPGLERKDIELSVKDGILTLRGEKRMETSTREGKFHRIERRYGSFFRALALPETVDAERIDARFKDGVLRIALPKRPESKPRAISIQE